jgi:Na+/phosphate symporter
VTERRDPRRRASHRWRIAALWGVTALIAGFTLFGVDDDDEAAVSPAPAATGVTASDDAAKIRIDDLSSVEVAPGDAVVARVEGLDPSQPVTVTVSKDVATLLSRSGDRLVIQLPSSVEPGKASLHVAQGDRKSKGYDLKVKPLKRRRQIRELIGGLAFLLFGLRLLSRGFRSWAGARVRAALQTATRGTARAVGLGIGLGALTQLTTSAAGLVVGLLDARLLGFVAAAALLLGAQLGASLVGSLLPLAFTRESLPVIAVGVAWISLAADRRGEALGNAILGGGLLLYGLHLLHLGFQPLVADPQLLPLLTWLRGDAPANLLGCAATGAVLSALLQGPGAAFGLVLGLAQSSGALDLDSAIALLAGSAIGAALDTAVVAWPFGREARRMAVTGLALSGIVAAVALAGLPLWMWLARLVAAGDPGDVDFGKKILLPAFGPHLTIAFLLSQVAGVAAAAALLPACARLARRAIPSARRSEHGADVSSVLALHQAAIESNKTLLLRGDRGEGARAEHALDESRAMLEGVLRVLEAPGAATDPQLLRTAVASSTLQRSIEDLLRLSEKAVEQNVTFAAGEVRQLGAVHGMVTEGLEALRSAVESNGRLDLEAARGREIRLNAAEASSRAAIVAEPSAKRDPDVSGTILAGPLRVKVTELLDAYEGVGNHVYRLCEAFGANDVDEFVA